MINFLKYRIIAWLFSLSMLVGFIGYYVYKNQSRGYVFSYSVDFTGGTQILFKFNKPIIGTDIENILDENGWPGAITREFSGNNDVLIRVKEVATDAIGLAERMRSVMEKAFPGAEVTVLQSESVGPGIGADLRWKSMRAVLIALAAMLLYIALRFWSLGFALGAVVALFHDAFAMLAIFLLFDLEISINVIGAILAVLGYSINDTIVIYSSIRSNIKKMRGASITQIVNVSLNETFRRTLLTSISTALTVGAMFVLGGQVLRDFSLALLVGIIFGTYSSIYIASSVIMMLHKESDTPS
ncbi:protein translocase subunit SecF [Candidatus Dependentiae bacterium]|nr:protein translocase subunit SecF [Candidatus Dependentiae bacterium]